MRLCVYKETAVRAPVSGLKRLFESIVDDEAEPDWSSRVNLVFTGDKRVRELNRQFRAKDATTDVLSFTLDGPEETDGTFGEIYISVPFAKRQAEGYGGTLREELLRLFCHGMLHLFGYDHHQAADARRMEGRQEHYLQLVMPAVSRGNARC